MSKEKIIIGKDNYIVLCERKIEELEKIVNRAITQCGYKPIGGIVISNDAKGMLYLQVISKLPANICL